MVVQENAPLSSTKTTKNFGARSAREVLEESYLAWCGYSAAAVQKGSPSPIRKMNSKPRKMYVVDFKTVSLQILQQ